jgi:hypothetical protein
MKYATWIRLPDVPLAVEARISRASGVCRSSRLTLMAANTDSIWTSDLLRLFLRSILPHVASAPHYALCGSRSSFLNGLEADQEVAAV